MKKILDYIKLVFQLLLVWVIIGIGCFFIVHLFNFIIGGLIVFFGVFLLVKLFTKILEL